MRHPWKLSGNPYKWHCNRCGKSSLILTTKMVRAECLAGETNLRYIIDPEVQELITTARNVLGWEEAISPDAERLQFWEDREAVLSQSITRRLNPDREVVRKAIESFEWLMVPPVTYGRNVDGFLDDFADHVIRELEQSTAGGGGSR